MNLIILAIFLFILFLYFLRIYRQLRVKWSCMPPFVHGHFLIGNYMQLQPSSIHKCITELGSKQGDLYSLSVFGQSFVVLNSSRAIYEILSNKTLEYAGRPTASLLRVASREFKDIAFAQPNEAWLQTRTIFNRFLQIMKRLHDQQYLSEIVFYKEWPKLHTVLNESQCEPIDLKPLLNSLQLKIICTILFGEEISNDRVIMNKIKELDRHAKIVISHVYEAMLNMHPISLLFGDGSCSNLLKAILIQKSLMKILFDDKNTKQTDNVSIRSLLDIMKNVLNSRDTMLDEVHVSNCLMELIFAGVDTIVNGVYGVFLYLSKYPQIQAKVYEELLQIKAHSFQLKHAKCLVYTQACIYETLRLISHIPLSIFRRTLVDVEQFGFLIPEDTVVVPNLWKLHHDDQVYPLPFEYKPERWLDPNGQLIDSQDLRMKYFMPFGAGKRACPGHHVANNVIFLFVTNFIYNFNLKLHTQNVNVDPRSFKLKSNLEPNAYNVLLEKRIHREAKPRTHSSDIKSFKTQRKNLIKSIIESDDDMDEAMPISSLLSDDVFDDLDDSHSEKLV